MIDHKHNAIKEMDKVLADTSVSADDTLFALEELKEHLSSLIDVAQLTVDETDYDA